MKLDLSEAVFCRVDEDAALAYIEHRKAMRKPLTQRAFDRAMRNAHKCESFGITATEAIDITMDKGWAGVTVEYIMRELENRRNAVMNSTQNDFSTRGTSLQQDITDKSWVN